MPDTPRKPLASIVIPAHDEERGIERLLRGLLCDAQDGELEIVVVANGCSDATADVAAAVGTGVRVVSTPQASKHHALQLGDGVTTAFPRLYVDADVELDVGSVRALVTAVTTGGVLAAAPERRLVLERRPALVRAYYRFWQALPGVRQGLFGRGVIAVSAAGHARVAAMPPVIADDLFLHRAFAPSERTVVSGAVAVVHAPRRTRDLVLRRVRVAAGCAEQQDSASVSDGGTSWRDVVRTATADVAMLVRLPAFVLVTLLSRSCASRMRRRGDAQRWFRDSGSRDAA